MIIQIRGTSGSGKSTVMRQVMKELGTWMPCYLPGRKQPFYYHLDNMAVLGHYESPCGGCDTIGSAGVVYRETMAMLQIGVEIVLTEGLLLSEDVKWSSQLPDLRVLYLTTSLETCLSQIKDRREQAGNDKPLNILNTANRIPVIERSRVKLTTAGVYCRRSTSRQAPAIVLNWIRLHANQGE